MPPPPTPAQVYFIRMGKRERVPDVSISEFPPILSLRFVAWKRAEKPIDCRQRVLDNERPSAGEA